MKLRDLFYELLAIPLLVPLLHNSVYGWSYTWSIPWDTNNTLFSDYNYTYVVDSNLNIKTIYNNVEYPFFIYTYNWENCYNWTRAIIYWWNNWQLFSYASFRSSLIFWQWYITKVCKSNVSNFESDCSRENIINNSTTDISELYTSSYNYDEFYVNDTSVPPENPECYAWNVIICFISHSSDIVYCSYSTATYWYNDLSFVDKQTIISSIWVIPNAFENEINNLVFQDSPIVSWWAWWWWWSSRWDLVELDSVYSVSEVLNAYWEMWYTNNLCYWNFSLDDLAVSWSTQQFFEQDLDDWVYFTWASIFDLYRVYSWWYSFNTFMNSRLARFYPSYTNDISLWFIWYSKALWYNQYLIYIHRPTIQNFSYQNLYNFCYLSVAIIDWSVSLDDNFNNSMINNWSLPSSVEEELESPWSILIPWTWSIFNWSWFTPWSWWAWWGGRSRGEWDEPSDAYWLFARLFDYISWLSDAVDLWLTKQWILPSVIQFWFLVALLYYILKR